MDGIYEGTVAFPQYGEAGTWKVNYTILQDAVGNYKQLYASDLTALGFGTSLDVACTALPNPTITLAAGANPSCPGQPVTLDAGSGYASYFWSTGASTRTIVVSPTAATTYSVTVTAGCGSASTNYTQNVNSLPTASVGGSATICAGLSTPLSGSGGVKCAWSPVTDLSNPASCTPAAWPAGTTTYSLTVTDAYGCVSTNNPTVTVTVVAAPAVAITPATPGAACLGTFGDVVTASVVGAPVVLYQWGIRTVSGGSIQPIPGANGPTYTLRGDDFGAPGSYFVVATVLVSCGGPYVSNERQVTIGDALVVSISPAGTVGLCPSQVVTLTTGVSGGGGRPYSYQWFKDGTAIPGATLGAYVASAAGSYDVSVSDGQGCVKPSAPTAVVAASPPSVTISPGGPTTFCANGNVTLTAAASGGSGTARSWQWYRSGLAIPGAMSNSVVAWSPGVYTAIVRESTGCTGAGPGVTVTVTGR